ncbi:hypothetical protein RB2654_14825 [Rhodobacterales bacterium HTCC2654]|uniref:Uncharacterized protein n=1 Tax=Maritimibacter alkaliphilus HTCC2654 TaxID=314271 RepID=A3VH14_9RHOB|nr:hypothetical protein RB2654_14825 [Rhodobacterales bacterium HTCC2654] [Maritimibacter alkaliphilus HTCC2654]
MWPGSVKVRFALSPARFTDGSATNGSPFNASSTRDTQEAQCIPSTLIVMSFITDSFCR